MAAKRTPPYWEHYPHVADMGIRGVGHSVAEAFEQAALALTAVICSPETVNPACTVDIDCASNDRELLLVDWLNALVYAMATRHMLFSRFEVTLSEHGLHARLHGESVDVARHQPRVEVKGATYTDLRVAQGEDGNWYAQCVVDI